LGSVMRSARSRADSGPGLCSGSTGGSVLAGEDDDDVVGVISYGHRIPVAGTGRIPARRLAIVKYLWYNGLQINCRGRVVALTVP
jgi:hypothetical protein